MNYPGGKSGAGVFQQIINQIPPHDLYVEPFLGSGAILRHKLPAPASIGIDGDTGIVVRWGAGEFGVVPGLTVISGDAISFLHRQKERVGPTTFIYCDPPYLFDVRSSKRPMYNVEFGETAQHAELLSVLLALPCMVAISGYQSSLYGAMLANWRTISYQTINRAGIPVTEWLWMNYPQPTALHDYRYLGNNFRERERLARIRRRWVARLGRMDALERLMLSAAIAESVGDAPSVSLD